VRGIVQSALAVGITSNRGIAAYLNEMRIPTSRGGDNLWHGSSIGSVRKRLGL